MHKRDEAVEARGESSDSTDSTDSTGVGRRRIMPFEELYQVCVCVCLCVCVCARNGVYAHTHTHKHTNTPHTHTHTDGRFSGGVCLGAELAFGRYTGVSLGCMSAADLLWRQKRPTREAKVTY
jgi:hypothetical protein